jgi:hypothetical protein
MMRQSVTAAFAALFAGLPVAASAQQGDKISDGVVKFGLILDMASLYSEITGGAGVPVAFEEQLSAAEKICNRAEACRTGGQC